MRQQRQWEPEFFVKDGNEDFVNVIDWEEYLIQLMINNDDLVEARGIHPQ